VENAAALQQAGSMAPLMRDIIKLKNAKAKDLEESVKGLLSPRGRINVVERNNALLVFDTRANIHEIRAAVKDLDIETYQVNIQAQLIQVDADAVREIGVDWQFGVGSGALGVLKTNPGQVPAPKSDFSMLGTSNQSAQSGSSSGSSGSSGSSDGSSGGSIVGGVAGATTQLAFGLLNGNLAVAVANLVKNLKGEVLAKPQITTIDNTEARIFMGEQVPIRVLDANGRQAIQLQDAGTSLTVTPHVTADGRVLLDLNPEKNSFRVDASAGTILQKQSAKTSVVVNDGETVVIAGLTTKEETETETGVPLLKDIPLLGYLFKHTATVSRKRDLIIFVTPHIVAQANRGEDLAKNDPKDFKDSEGVYGDYSPKAGPSSDASKGKSAADTTRIRSDYP
jgi:type IV pilus secretin PilQ/predicted competence protein